MSNLFRTHQLGEVSEIIAGGDKPKVFSLDKNASLRVPVLANAEKNNGLMGYTDNARIFEPAVTVAARGSNVGFVAVRKEPFFPVVRLLSLIPKKDRLDVDYLFYNLKQNRKTGTGSGQPQITIPDISSKTIALPPISVQKKVSEVLSVLDKKIELNNRINAELEAMAKTLYDYWFVQFDFPDDSPQGQGKPYKTSGGKMVYNPILKREIPEGWEVLELSDNVSILNGYAFKSGDYSDDGIFVLRTKNFNSSNAVERLEDDVFLPPSFLSTHQTYLCRPFDYHLVMVGASVGKTSIIYEHHLPALRNQNMWCFRSKSGLVGQAFVKQTLDHLVIEKKNHSSGSAREFYTKGYFLEHLIVMPESSVLNHFEQICINYMNLQANKANESDKMMKLRDWLLPMLMNGQVTVGKAS